MKQDDIGVCPICGGVEFEAGFQGRMVNNTTAPQCRSCGSAERHRIIRNIYISLKPLLKNWRCLQFAPEGALDRHWFKSYDYSAYGGHNSYDMTAIDLPDACFDIVVSNHVIEHVSDDRAAMRECLRIVGDTGLVHVNAPSPAFRARTQDWGYPDPKRNEHYRDYGADMGLVLGTAIPDAYVLGVVGMDPVTFVSDIVFMFSLSETLLDEVSTTLQKGSQTPIRLR
ncbi:methyltransferase domain-containing protein [Pseudaestuariivita rosea]|uniref:methyltransferase domain-containing protein n=1 Tax=Pseudaestuariivita rosea TaxID=2763263 RepID=UPI001ABAB63C|nr:methyltransferase domain-containing protein [Pseudaestuariivita rosea]